MKIAQKIQLVKIPDKGWVTENKAAKSFEMLSHLTNLS